MSAVLYAEGLHPGTVFELGSTKVSKKEILGFGLIAGGFNTVALPQRLVVDAVFSRAALIAGREPGALRMREPVRPGDVLHGAVEIVAVRPRDDGIGVVRSRGTLTNDSGAVRCVGMAPVERGPLQRR